MDDLARDSAQTSQGNEPLCSESVQGQAADVVPENDRSSLEAESLSEDASCIAAEDVDCDAEDAELSDVQVAADDDRPVPCEFVTGRAGTGKSYGLVKAVQDDPAYGQLCATTGIASVNLGTVTLNSVLRYFDTASLRDNFLRGRLTSIIHALAVKSRRLLIDEGSMLDGQQLGMIYRAVVEANRYQDVEVPFGITISGDLAQLPPINAPWIFESECWPAFAANVTRLERVWRQGAGAFLDALNLTREGRGGEAAEVLSAAGLRWQTSIQNEWDGTTILGKNDQVNRYNAMALERVKGERFRLQSRRWGKQSAAWGQNTRTKEWGVPQTLDLKIGAYVMMLANTPDFSVVNGDCGHVIEHNARARQGRGYVRVKLIRTGREELIWPIVRDVSSADKPDGWTGKIVSRSSDEGEYIPSLHYRGKARRYVQGQIEYYPIRLAYASTVHKSQGLTLDRVQVDIRDWFMKKPAMVYVAMSRCRTLEGLRVVGQPDVYARQCSVEAKVRPWL